MTSQDSCSYTLCQSHWGVGKKALHAHSCHLFFFSCCFFASFLITSYVGIGQFYSLHNQTDCRHVFCVDQAVSFCLTWKSSSSHQSRYYASKQKSQSNTYSIKSYDMQRGTLSMFLLQMRENRRSFTPSITELLAGSVNLPLKCLLFCHFWVSKLFTIQTWQTFKSVDIAAVLHLFLTFARCHVVTLTLYISYLLIYMAWMSSCYLKTEGRRGRSGGRGGGFPTVAQAWQFLSYPTSFSPMQGPRAHGKAITDTNAHADSHTPPCSIIHTEITHVLTPTGNGLYWYLQS